MDEEENGEVRVPPPHSRDDNGPFLYCDGNRPKESEVGVETFVKI